MLLQQSRQRLRDVEAMHQRMVQSLIDKRSEAAIIDTLTRYNAAETETAALLRIEPIQPYLDPQGPFAERRAVELAERQRRNAPHRSILLRWGIGDISVNGTTATVVTQETWSNQVWCGENAWCAWR